MDNTGTITRLSGNEQFSANNSFIERIVNDGLFDLHFKLSPSTVEPTKVFLKPTFSYGLDLEFGVAEKEIRDCDSYTVTFIGDGVKDRTFVISDIEYRVKHTHLYHYGSHLQCVPIIAEYIASLVDAYYINSTRGLYNQVVVKQLTSISNNTKSVNSTTFAIGETLTEKHPLPVNLSILVPYTPKNALMSTYCVGNNVWGNYSDGNGGTYQQLIKENSVQCGGINS